MTPKSDFLKTQAAKSHYDLTATEPFKQAMNACMLQVVAENAITTSDGEQAQAGFHRIVGAVQFYKTLMNLGTQPEAPKTKIPANLDHGLK